MRTVTGFVRPRTLSLLGASLLVPVLGGCVATATSSAATVPMSGLLSQPAEWYSTAEAIRIADNVLLYQRSNGGWPPNRDMTAPVTDAERERLLSLKDSPGASIDNQATYPQIRYLARVHGETGLPRFGTAAIAGLDYLLDAQYDHGGWPQYWPVEGNESPRNSVHNSHDLAHFITLNDDAMAGVASLMRDVARGEGEFRFVDAARRERARRAMERAVDLLLDLQVVSGGLRTGWAAQYDEQTLEPRWGRKFEPVSLAGRESVGVVRLLMSLEDPRPEVVEAIQSAVAWFDRVKLHGVRVEVDPEVMEVDNWDGTRRFTDRHDHRLVKDPDAPPLWARFYEIGTDRPVFASDDDTVRYDHSEITPERRSGYDWFGYWPRDLLAEDYPAWAWRQEIPAEELVVRDRVLSMTYAEARGHLAGRTVPTFWKSRVEDVEERLGSLRAGRASVIATSPGGRPVHLVTYGEREPLPHRANFNSAAGGRDLTAYHDPAARTRPVVLFVGPVHGQEVEGLVGLMNLIEVMETGRDLLGRDRTTLRDLGLRARLLIIPTGNPDGVARFEPGHLVGLTLADKEFWGQGTWADDRLVGYPAVKLQHPMVGDNVGHLGSYFNDAGVNPMHDEFFRPLSTEAPAILNVAREEAPDLAVSLHSHRTPPGVIRPAYVPIEVQEEVRALSHRYVEALEAQGLPAGPHPRVGPESGTPPPYFNLVSALHHVSGAVAFIHEESHGLTGYGSTQLTLEQIVDVELTLYEAMLRHALER